MSVFVKTFNTMTYPLEAAAYALGAGLVYALGPDHVTDEGRELIEEGRLLPK